MKTLRIILGIAIVCGVAGGWFMVQRYDECRRLGGVWWYCVGQ